LNPRPTEADLFQLIKISTDSFYPLQTPITPTNTDEKVEKPESELVNVDEMILHGNALYDQTSKSLDDMLKTILDRDMGNNGLSGIFKHIEPWLTSVNEHERLRSMRSLSRVLKHFLESVKLRKKDTQVFYLILNVYYYFVNLN
jgi:hypothetical protein